MTVVKQNLSKWKMLHNKKNATHECVIHAIVPAFGKRDELCVVIESFVAAALGCVAVQHDLVTAQC